MTLPCRAVVFDFDGVIVDSNPIKVAALAELYRGHGAAFGAEIAAYYHRHAGVSRDRMFQHIEEVLLGRPVAPDRIAALSRRFGELVEDAVTACPPIAGALEFVRRHTGAVRLSVASGTPEEELRRIVERRGWTPLFAAVRGSPMHKADVVAEILRTQDLAPAQTVMVGDALTDLESAQRNGLPFVGIVPPGAENIFPAGTHIEPDLTGLEAAIATVVRWP